MVSASCKLKDPFPVQLLADLNLGNMDGHRDELTKDIFILTRSVISFLDDKHSIISGPFGSGKSAIFNLLKNGSGLLKTYADDLVVTIDEQIQFQELKNDSETFFPNLSERLKYQLLWKFQTCRRVSEEIAKLENFPVGENEEYLGEFLNRTGGQGGYLSVMARLKDLASKFSFKINAKLSDVPVDVELSKDSSKTTKRIELNLDAVIMHASRCIEKRGLRQATVIIDKIDKFVAGEEYQTQRSYIESLLQLEDDLYGEKKIRFKIFIRSDLYDRLDFSALGPDKAEDNTLRLVWSKEEIRSFLAKRIYNALAQRGVWDLDRIIESSDLSDYSLRWYERRLLKDKTIGVSYIAAHIYSKLLGRKPNRRTLHEKVDLTVIGKLFFPELLHECPDGKKKSISYQDFLDTHFLDGNNSCTPRYMLVFLKELFEEANNYYLKSPNVIVTPVLHGGDWVYKLLTPELVYGAYLKAKEKYIRHIAKVDDKWAQNIAELLGKKSNKKTFDYKWIRNNITFVGDANDQALSFLIYLQVIGFFKVRKFDVDIRKRLFELPILYSSASGAVEHDI